MLQIVYSKERPHVRLFNTTVSTQVHGVEMNNHAVRVRMWDSFPTISMSICAIYSNRGLNTILVHVPI